MTVKSKRGRIRYVVFDVSLETTKDSLIKKLKAAPTEEPPYIVQCASGKAVVRCSPEKRESVILLISAVDRSSVPLLTSGTLHKIRSIYPELKPTKK